MNFVKYRKYISIVTIFTLLVFGMCFDINVEAYSFLTCENLSVPEIAPVSGHFQEGTTITSGIRTSVIRQTYLWEASCKQEILPGVATRSAGNNIRSVRNDIYVLLVVSTCLLLFLYFMLWEICPNLHKIYNNIVVVSYIHQQDGKKVYSY